MKYDTQIDSRGNKWYYANKVLHRDGGPAIEYVSGYKAWYKNGKRHREDGPAVEYAEGSKFWYLNDKIYGENNDFTIKSWKAVVKTLIFS